MNVGKIADANKIFTAPKNWDTARHGECQDLLVRIEDGNTFASAWTPTPEELTLLQLGGSVILRVVGIQPPVSLTVEFDLNVIRPALAESEVGRGLLRAVEIDGVLTPAQIAELKVKIADYVRPRFAQLTDGWETLTLDGRDQRLRIIDEFIIGEGGSRYPAEVRIIDEMRKELGRG